MSYSIYRWDEHGSVILSRDWHLGHPAFYDPADSPGWYTFADEESAHDFWVGEFGSDTNYFVGESPK